MGTLQNIFQEEIVQRLGWTLVHFVWQATVVAVILAIVLRLLRKYSANLRYLIACLALILIVLMPAITIRMVDVSVETIKPIKQAVVDLPEAGADAQAVVEMPQVESPLTQVAASPRISLKDKFIETVEPTLGYMVVGWLIGVLGLSVWHLGGWRQLQRLRRQMVKQVSERVRLRLKHLAERMGVKRAVGIMESAMVQVPTVVGWLKPLILLPASALTGLSGEQIEAILAHELAHIKRCDYLVNICQTVVEILGFYHPAVWWVSHEIRAERENCCDDIAVSICNDRVCYAKALTTMEEIRAGQPALAIAASGGSLFSRIRRLLGKDGKNETKASWLPSVITILLIMALIIPTALAFNAGSGHKPSSQEDYRIRHFVRVVVGKDKITFQGKETTWGQLPNLLEQVSHKNITVLEIGFTEFFKKRKDISTNEWLSNQVGWRKAAQLRKQFGFEYLSFVGKHELGAISGGTRNYLVRPMELAKEIEVNLPSAEDKPLVYLSTIEFSKDKAVIKAEVTSYPKTKWDIEVAFFDQKMKRLDYIFKNYENSGIIIGVAVNHTEMIEVDISKIKDLEKAKFFELSIKQAENRDQQASNSENIIDIKPNNFKLQFNSERSVYSLVVSIKNESSITIPEFKLRFYKDDPAKNLDEVGNQHRGWHGAGPIESGNQWNEKTRDFYLPDGEYEFVVVLDYDNTFSETDENNNTASIKVVIKDGQIEEEDQNKYSADDISEQTERDFDQLTDDNDITQMQWEEWAEQMEQWAEKFGQKYKNNLNQEQWQQWSENMHQWSKELKQFYSEQQKEQKQGWGQTMRKWNEEMRQWREEMQQWNEEMQQWQEDQQPVAPTPPVLVIPPVPNMPAMPEIDIQSIPSPPFESDTNGEGWLSKLLHGKQQAQYKRIENLSGAFASGATLAAETSRGSITIRGGDVTDCKVKVTINAHAKREKDAKKLAEQVKVWLDNSDKKVVVKIEKPDLANNQTIGVSLDIVIPRQANVNFAVARGNVTIEDIEGNAKTTTSRGSITAKNIQGSVELVSSRGNIICEEISGNEFELATSRGNIKLINSSADNAKISLSRGHVTCRQVTFKDLTASLSRGNIELIDSSTDMLKINTSRGEINISETSADNVKISLSRGHVACRQVAFNDLTASLSRGHFDISYSAQAKPGINANVTTSRGNINFTLPDNFAGKVDLGTNKGTIKTDLPIIVEGEISSNRIKGRIREGDGKLYLKASRGSIKLRN